MAVIPDNDMQALRQSFYNTLALLFIAGFAAIGYAVYYVLEAFLKPLLWAFTIGICLHPFKSLLTQYVRNWLKTMDKTGKPLIIGSLILPLQLFSSTSDVLTEKIQSNGRLILVFAISIPLFQLLYLYGPFSVALSFLHSVIIIIYDTLGWFSTFWVATFILGYVMLVLFYWTPTSAPWLKAFAVPIWIVLILYLAGISGPIGVPLFVSCVALMLIGIVSYAKDHSIAIFSTTHISYVLDFVMRSKHAPPDSSIDSCGDATGDIAPTSENCVENDLNVSSNLAEVSYEDVPVESESSPTLNSETSSPSMPPQISTAESHQDTDRVDEIADSNQRFTLYKFFSNLLQQSSSRGVDATDAVPNSKRTSSGVNHNNAGLRRQYSLSGKPRSRSSQQLSVSRTIVRRAFLCLFWAHVIVYMWSNVWFVVFLPCAWIFVMAKRLFSRLSSSAASNTPSNLSPPLQERRVVSRTSSESEATNISKRLQAAQNFPTASAPVISGDNVTSSTGSSGNDTVSLTTNWFNWICDALGDRKQALAPAPVRGLFCLLLKADSRIRHFLDASLDSIVSIFVILLVIIGTLLVLIFLAFQIHRESIHLVFMTGNLLNSTIHSDALKWVPHKESFTALFDSMAGNAYVFGREWITKKMDELLVDTNPYNKARIEEQVLQMWDMLYQRLRVKNESVMQAITDKGTRDGGRHISQWATQQFFSHGLWETLKSFELLDMKSVVMFVKENLGLFSTVLESVWIVLKSNINLGMSLLSTLLSLLFGGGSALLNFIVSFLIFLTALCYLLAYSGEVYLPVQFIISLSPYADRWEQQRGGSRNCTPSSVDAVSGSHVPSQKLRAIYLALEAAVSSVFAATVKMALFYGFYTVFTHNLVGVNLVVIPAVLAAILGAVPFIGTYWATVPGVMELCLRQDYVLAVVLFGAHLLPTYVVDTAIYSEIEGVGHPYLTGLAIAGGVYCFGLAGAIVGPMLLCILLAAANVYSSVLSTNTSTAEAGHSTDKGVRRFPRSLSTVTPRPQEFHQLREMR